ncbi:MAG: hypothetical protein NHG36_02545 [Chromatiaceae bacterium]|nr:hypothetical protein [Candidatus Thioaporhodococcus sediminis]
MGAPQIGTPTTPTTQAPAPTATSQPNPFIGLNPQAYGLLPQMTGTSGTYGQYKVANPYLGALNQRFGWSPSGIAQGYNLDSGGTYYRPPIRMPRVSYPSLTLPQTAQGGTGGQGASGNPFGNAGGYPWFGLGSEGG